MPGVVKMSLSSFNSQIMLNHILASSKPRSEPVQSMPAPKGGLSNSMIQRIHSIKPGCGSCGRR